MSDLIRREDAFSKFEKACTCYSVDKNGMKRGEIKTALTWEGIRKILDNIPTAEPERKKGEWIEYPDCLGYDGAYSDDHIVCSDCGHVFSILDNCTEEFDFCPHCGADMRGE